MSSIDLGKIPTKKFGPRSLFMLASAYLTAPLTFGTVGMSVVGAIILWPFGLQRRLLSWCTGLFGTWMVSLLGLDVRVAGLENVRPDTNYVVAANHRSWLDVAAVIYALEGKLSPVFMIKEGLLRIPIFGAFMRAAGYIPIRRQKRGAQSHNQNQLEQAARFVKEGATLLVFPEGTRVETHAFARFKQGAAVIAIAAEVPILPISISGTGRLFPRGTPWPRSGPISVDIQEPVMTAGRESVAVNADLLLSISGGYRPHPTGLPLKATPGLWEQAIVKARRKKSRGAAALNRP